MSTKDTAPSPAPSPQGWPETMYLYVWQDWGLFTVRPAEVVQADCPGPRGEGGYSLVLSPEIGGGRRPFMARKEHLFATREEAEAYGREHTPGGAW